MFEPDFLKENGQNGQKRTVIFRRGTDSFEKIEIWNTSGVNRSRHLPIRTTLASEYYVTFEKSACVAL